MSQEKVDRYKQEKATRKQTMKREKRKKAIFSVVSTLVCVFVAGWIGYSGFSYYQEQKKANPTSTEIDLSALDQYLNGLYAPEEAE